MFGSPRRRQGSSLRFDLTPSGFGLDVDSSTTIGLLRDVPANVPGVDPVLGFGVSMSGNHNRNNHPQLPTLLTVDEAAAFLRKTRRALYSMVERGQIPGVIRLPRRLLFCADELLHWIDQKRAPSRQENER